MPEEAEVPTTADVVTRQTASERSLDRLKSLHSLMTSLLTQLDNMRIIQRSFHETVNRSQMVSMCVGETSVVGDDGLLLPVGTSSFFSGGGAAEVSAIIPAEKVFSEFWFFNIVDVLANVALMLG